MMALLMRRDGHTRLHEFPGPAPREIRVPIVRDWNTYWDPNKVPEIAPAFPDRRYRIVDIDREYAGIVYYLEV